MMAWTTHYPKAPRAPRAVMPWPAVILMWALQSCALIAALDLWLPARVAGYMGGAAVLCFLIDFQVRRVLAAIERGR